MPVPVASEASGSGIPERVVIGQPNHKPGLGSNEEPSTAVGTSPKQAIRLGGIRLMQVQRVFTVRAGGVANRSEMDPVQREGQ